jgi:hypothetical protein
MFDHCCWLAVVVAKASVMQWWLWQLVHFVVSFDLWWRQSPQEYQFVWPRLRHFLICCARHLFDEHWPTQHHCCCLWPQFDWQEF